MVEGFQLKAAGNDLLAEMDNSEPGKPMDESVIRKVALKYKLTPDKMNELARHLYDSGAIQQKQRELKAKYEEDQRDQALIEKSKTEANPQGDPLWLIKERKKKEIDTEGDILKLQAKPNELKLQEKGRTSKGYPISFDSSTGKEYVTINGGLVDYNPATHGQPQPIAPPIKIITPKPDSPEKPMSRKEKLDRATNLRKEFNQRPEVKEYNLIQPKLASIEKAWEQSKKTGKFIASDQALITLFNKLTDPNSVVRESEYARMAINMPLVNAIQGKAMKVLSGGAGLTKEERNQIIDMAKMMKGAYQETFDMVADEYTGYAKSYELDPELVIGKNRKSAKPTVSNW
jgi:hypothetical protein